MERPLAHSTAAVNGDAVTAQMPSRGIVSVKVSLAR